MREFVVAPEFDDHELVRFVRRVAPGLTFGLAKSYFRRKEIKLNGRPGKPEQRVKAGDLVRMYLPEELFEAQKRPDPLLSRFKWDIDVVYEDEDAIIIDKRPGQLVHPDKQEKVNTLITHVRAYLYQKGEYDPQAERVFHPVPVNRIDRFTSGLVLFARSEAAMRALNALIRERRIQKRYLLICLGAMPKGSGALENWLFMNEKRASVLDSARQGAKWSVTRYRTLEKRNGLSLVEAELETGRTHQIRAQFAHAGHPLLGDNQYGDRARNQRFDVQQQALTAWSVTFPEDDRLPQTLRGRTFRTRRVPYVKRFFPDFQFINIDALV